MLTTQREVGGLVDAIKIMLYDRYSRESNLKLLFVYVCGKYFAKQNTMASFIDSRWMVDVIQATSNMYRDIMKSMVNVNFTLLNGRKIQKKVNSKAIELLKDHYKMNVVRTCSSKPTTVNIVVENAKENSNFYAINDPDQFSENKLTNFEAIAIHHFLRALMEILTICLDAELKLSAKKKLLLPRIKFIKSHFYVGNKYEAIFYERLQSFLIRESDENIPLHHINFCLIEGIYDHIQTSKNASFHVFAERLKKIVKTNVFLSSDYGEKEYHSIDNEIIDLNHIFKLDDDLLLIPA
jgi:hypothetical protein